MARAEILNIEEFEDSAATHGFGHTGEARFAGPPLELSETGFSHHRLHPGKRQAFGHKHDAAEEVYVVIAGSGRVKLDDDVRDISRLDVVRVSPEVIRCFEAGEEGMEFLAFGPAHDGDGEILPGWWTD